MKISYKKHAGFTLIELLVVIAIIAILSTIVLASLGTARQRARDTRAKSELSQMRAQAELYFTNGNTFDGVCTAIKKDQGLKEMVDSITKNTVSGSVTCFDDGTTWSAKGTIVGEAGAIRDFCADSTGFAGLGTQTGSDNAASSCTPAP